MQTIGLGLAIIYAGLAGISACVTFLSHQQMSIWLLGANLLAVAFMLSVATSLWFPIVGIVAMLIIAPLNGYLVLGQGHLSHWLTRLVISLVMIGLLL